MLKIGGIEMSSNGRMTVKEIRKNMPRGWKESGFRIPGPMLDVWMDPKIEDPEHEFPVPKGARYYQRGGNFLRFYEDEPDFPPVTAIGEDGISVYHRGCRRI